VAVEVLSAALAAAVVAEMVDLQVVVEVLMELLILAAGVVVLLHTHTLLAVEVLV
jgi:hypothetical protein